MSDQRSLDAKMRRFLDNELVERVQKSLQSTKNNQIDEKDPGGHKSTNEVPENRLADYVLKDVVLLLSQQLKLDQDRIEVDENIANFGANSIVITEFISQISKKYDISLLATMFFEAKNLKDLAGILADRYKKELHAYYLAKEHALEPETAIKSDHTDEKTDNHAIDSKIMKLLKDYKWLEEDSIYVQGPNGSASIPTQENSLEHKAKKHTYLNEKSLIVELETIGVNKPNLFFLPPVFGVPDLFPGLAQRLSDTFDCYGLRCKGFDGSSPFDKNIKRMAKTFSKEVLKIQQEGKFLLVGYSMGSVVGFELAKLLEKRRYEVNLVCLDGSVSSKFFRIVNDKGVDREIDRYLNPVKDKDKLKPLLLHNFNIIKKHKIKGKIKGAILALEAEHNPMSTQMQEWRKYTRGYFKHQYIAGSHVEILNEGYLPDLSQKLLQYFDKK